MKQLAIILILVLASCQPKEDSNFDFYLERQHPKSIIVKLPANQYPRYLCLDTTVSGINVYDLINGDKLSPNPELTDDLTIDWNQRNSYYEEFNDPGYALKENPFIGWKEGLYSDYNHEVLAVHFNKIAPGSDWQNTKEVCCLLRKYSGYSVIFEGLGYALITIKL